MKQRLTELERKAQTRTKIKLGGLIVKAGLEQETPATLLGLLLEAAEILQSSAAKESRNKWQLKGSLAFLES